MTLSKNAQIRSRVLGVLGSSNLMEIISFNKDLLGISFEIAVIQDMLEVEFGIIDHQLTLRVIIQGL